ncbi:MAG: hypothetical protein HY074_18865 [Deltaproteobacteria bacterium]|nr:hypothetical protein [Deltaproteobacteria bacterium]
MDSDEAPPTGAVKKKSSVEAPELLVAMPAAAIPNEKLNRSKDTPNREARQRENAKRAMPLMIQRFFYLVMAVAVLWAAARYYKLTLADDVSDYVTHHVNLIKGWMAGER